MRRFVAIFTLVLLSVEARANDLDADVRSVIDRGICFYGRQTRRLGRFDFACRTVSAACCEHIVMR